MDDQTYAAIGWATKAPSGADRRVCVRLAQRGPTRRDICEALSRFGKIEHASFKGNKAYVQFAERESMKAAICARLTNIGRIAIKLEVAGGATSAVPDASAKGRLLVCRRCRTPFSYKTHYLAHTSAAKGGCAGRPDEQPGGSGGSKKHVIPFLRCLSCTTVVSQPAFFLLHRAAEHGLAVIAPVKLEGSLSLDGPARAEEVQRWVEWQRENDAEKRASIEQYKRENSEPILCACTTCSREFGSEAEYEEHVGSDCDASTVTGDGLPSVYSCLVCNCHTESAAVMLHHLATTPDKHALDGKLLFTSKYEWDASIGSETLAVMREHIVEGWTEKYLVVQTMERSRKAAAAAAAAAAPFPAAAAAAAPFPAAVAAAAPPPAAAAAAAPPPAAAAATTVAAGAAAATAAASTSVADVKSAMQVQQHQCKKEPLDENEEGELPAEPAVMASPPPLP